MNEFLGGFQQFWQHYPHLCVSGPVTCGSGQGVHPLGLNHAPRSPPAGLAGHAGHNHLWPPTLSPLGALSRSSSSPALAQAANGLGPINSHSNNHNGHVPHASTLPWYQQEQQDPVEILPHLFLGSEYHASNKATLQRLVYLWPYMKIADRFICFVLFRCSVSWLVMIFLIHTGCRAFATDRVWSTNSCFFLFFFYQEAWLFKLASYTLAFIYCFSFQSSNIIIFGKLQLAQI